jgi:uncharacterized protein (DUF1697 family)
MPTWIAFFRGINVGGKNPLRMRDLTAVLKRLDCADIRTYIQSGNVVFQSSEGKADALSRRIASSIARERGFEPVVMVFGEKELAGALSGNPFPKAQSDPKSLHVFFLAAKPKSENVESLKQLKSKNERIVVKDKVLYLHAPDGIGNSKLAAAVERRLGVDATARNWRTAAKMLELAQRDG